MNPTNVATTSSFVTMPLLHEQVTLPMNRSWLTCTPISSRKNVPRATLCVHTVTTYYRLWPLLASVRLFHRFRIPPLFRPFFLQLSPSHFFGIRTEKADENDSMFVADFRYEKSA
jgi:hypothetical protein